MAGQVELLGEGLVEAQAFLHERDVHWIAELGAHGLQRRRGGQRAEGDFPLQQVDFESGFAQEVGGSDADDAAADDEDARHRAIIPGPTRKVKSGCEFEVIPIDRIVVGGYEV